MLLNGEKRIGHWVLVTLNAIVIACLTGLMLGMFTAGRQILINTDRLNALEASQREQDQHISGLMTTINDTNGYVRGIANYLGVKKEKKE